MKKDPALGQYLGMFVGAWVGLGDGTCNIYATMPTALSTVPATHSTHSQHEHQKADMA